MVGSSQVTAGFECVAGAAGIGPVRPHGYEIGTACSGELEAVKISSGHLRAGYCQVSAYERYED